jgi:hypothetical protein
MPKMLAATPAATERAGAFAPPGHVGSDTAAPDSTRRPGDHGIQVGGARVDRGHGRIRGRARRTPGWIEPAGVVTTSAGQ